ncbi:hypothetical protein [Actinocorallia longicatena]|uniref:Uncharacterized protein n=1 Tax=Actinocorallia longicatena TaxID=111803 RepID=A0ABP6QPN5_9ACTN
MDVVAQWVRTSWTKRSRGGGGAALRNAVPEAFGLPEGAAGPCVHEVTMDEHDGFAPRSTLRDGPPPRVDLREEDGLLRVTLTPDPWGHPVRRRRPPALRLPPGEWVRWRINHRSAPGCCGDEWTYHQEVLNLAYGRADAGPFLGVPARQVDERVHLF